MRSRVVAVPCALAALALGAGACGEDESEKLAMGEFRSKANAVCDKYDKRIDAVPNASGGGGNETELLKREAGRIEKVADLAEDAHGELSDLEPKDGALAKKWDTYLDQLDKTVGLIRESGEKAKDGDKSGAQAAAQRSQDIDADAEGVTGKGACAG